jgi:cytokinin dehydrogenase
MSAVQSGWSEADGRALAADGVFIRRDSHSRQEAGQDFGRVERGEPWGVATPRDISELERLVGHAARRRLPLTARGRGFSSSGQSLSVAGVTVDCSRLDRIDAIDTGARTVRCEAGTRWRELVAASLGQGLLPVVLPSSLDMSVGGLLSAGGLGASSHRHGTAASHAVDLQVVTAADGPVRCDGGERRDLYDAVLAGLGRCGAISQVTLALRPAPRRVRTYHLMYGDLATWLDDQRKLVRQQRADYLEGFTWASAKGIRSDHMGRRAFAHWLYGLQLGLEYDGQPPDAGVALAGLDPWRVVHVQDEEVTLHIERQQPRFDTMRRSGAWELTHPWLECLLPVERLADLLPQVLDALPPSLGDGHRLGWLARDKLPPLLAVPDAEEVACLAIVPPGVADFERDLVLQVFRQLDHSLRAAGGKRYPSGWLGRLTEQDWRQHHGPRYDAWMAAKRRYDPDRIFRSTLFP